MNKEAIASLACGRDKRGRMNDEDEIRELISHLSSIEQELLGEAGARPPWNSGKKIIERLAPAGRFGQSINTIPSGAPGGCHPLLIVALGWQEDAEPRILEAVEHLAVRCPGKTREVVFWAPWWSATAWLRHKGSFGSTRVSLKLFGADVLRLA
jgi:hypothetical protein